MYILWYMKTIVNIKTDRAVKLAANLRQTIAEAERELTEGKMVGPFSSVAKLRADLES